MGGVRVIDPASGNALTTRCVVDVVAASPDSTQVAVISTDRRVSACNLRTGATSTVAQFFGLLPAVRWTSTAISVASFDEQHQLLVIDVVQCSRVSHQTYPLPPDAIGGGASPSWSPDGTRLVLSAGRSELCVVRADP